MDPRRLTPPTQPTSAVSSGPAKPMGELRIEGRFIKRLILRRRVPGMNDTDQSARFRQGGDDTLTLDSPGSSVLLPVGEYHWQEVDLDDGAGSGQFMSYNFFDSEWLRVTEGKPATLKIGGPLECKLEVTRRGNTLELSEASVGVGEEQYASRNHAQNPRFTVYANDKPVGTGQFEYG